MTALTFDTLKYANRLKAAGIPAAYAEAEAEALPEVFEINSKELATKADVNKLEGSVDNKFDLLRKDIVNLETGLRKDMQVLELRVSGEMLLLKWMMGILIAGVASLVLKAFFWQWDIPLWQQ